MVEPAEAAPELHDPDAARPDGLRHGLSWSMVGGLGAGALLFAQLIVAGRLLGPTQFGTFSYVQTLAMIMLIPALAGFDMSSSRALSRSTDSLARRRIAMSSIVAVLTCSLATAAVVLVLAEPLARALGTAHEVVAWAMCFTVLLAQRWLMERHLSGLGRFRQQAMVRLSEALVTIASFVTARVILGIDDYRALVVAYSIGALTVVVGAHIADGHRVRPRDARIGVVRELVVYSGLMNAAYLFSTLLFQMDRFAVNGVLGATQLGLYAAYYSGSIFVVIQVLLIVSNVLYPAMARMPDKRAFVSRMDRLAPFAFVGGGTTLFGLVWLILALFGARFPFDPQLALIFATWSALAGINGSYAVVVNAHSERACAREVAFQPFRLLFLAGWFALLGASGALTLVLAGTGMLLAEVLEAFNLRFVLRRYVLR